MEPLALTPENVAAFAPTSEDVAYTHSVLAQCFLPLRRLTKGTHSYEVSHGSASLAIDAGRLLNPNTGELERQEVPSGSAARLAIGHIQTYVKRAPSLEEACRVPMGDSLRDFFKHYGKKWGGPYGREITRQVRNIAAMHMTIGVWGEGRAKQVNVPAFAQEIEFWLEKDERQRTLWQPEMVLNPEYARLIRSRALPYNMAAMLSLYASPRAMDAYLWLTSRLPTIPQGKGVFIPYKGPNGLHGIFSPGKLTGRRFKQVFEEACRQAFRVYPEARFSFEKGGICLWHSPPPIPSDSSLLASGRSPFFVGK